MKKVIFLMLATVLLFSGCKKEEKIKVDYINKLSIKIGESIPLSTEYIKNYDDINIIWNIPLEDNKVYNSGNI